MLMNAFQKGDFPVKYVAFKSFIYIKHLKISKGQVALRKFKSIMYSIIIGK